MTREEAIRQLKKQMMPSAPIASIEAVEMAVKALEQEKEPAPSANDASSKQKSYKNNDTAQSEICQEELSELFPIIDQKVQHCITDLVYIIKETGGIRDVYGIATRVHSIMIANLATLPLTVRGILAEEDKR